MVFSSFVFLYGFLPIALLLYFSFPGFNAKNTMLLVFSLLFYTWGEPIGVGHSTAWCFSRWAGGRLMSRNSQSRQGSVDRICRFSGSAADYL